MMVLTAKVDLKKVLLVLAAVALVILGIVLLAGKSGDSAASAPLSANDSRVEFLRAQGLEVALSPVETSQVRIPDTESPVFRQYNALQARQGFDLTQYAGKRVMRYVYEITAKPEAKAPVYATLLIYKNKVIGADITDTAPGGKMQPLMQAAREESPSSVSTLPAETAGEPTPDASSAPES